MLETNCGANSVIEAHDRKQTIKAGGGTGRSLKQMWRNGKACNYPSYRVLIVAAGALLQCSICQGQRESAGLELQSEDYSKARSHFQTHLVRHGAAPQRSHQLPTPAGAQRVLYSKTLSLMAWITPLPAHTSKRSDLSKTAKIAGVKKPAVLFLHGGFAIGGSDWQMAQPYRDAGYVVMMPVLRGENGQAGDYSLFYNEVQDVLTAADYLASRPDVDPKHIYLAGHSVGGTLALLTAMTTSRFRAAVAFSGSPDQIAWTKPRPEVVPFDKSNLREYRMRSPIAFATSFKCPVRMYYGSVELLFAPLTRQMATMAKQKSLDVEAVQVPGNHFTAVPDAMLKSIAFFRSK